MDGKTNTNPFDEHDFLYDDINISVAVKSLMFLNDAKPKIFYHGLTRDSRYTFREGCSLDDVNTLEQNIGFKLPDDYKQFLFHTNGLSFSHFTASPLFDIETIYQTREIFDQYPNNFLVIGSCSDGAFPIMIKLDCNNNSCMYIHDMAYEYLSHINCDFTTFFNRFVMTHGSPFWEWGVRITKIKAIEEREGISSKPMDIGSPFIIQAEDNID